MLSLLSQIPQTWKHLCTPKDPVPPTPEGGWVLEKEDLLISSPRSPGGAISHLTPTPHLLPTPISSQPEAHARPVSFPTSEQEGEVR